MVLLIKFWDGNLKPDKCLCFGYGIGFDLHSCFLIPIFNWGKNRIIFVVDTSLSTHTDNRGKDILVIGEGPTQFFYISNSFFLVRSLFV